MDSLAPITSPPAGVDNLATRLDNTPDLGEAVRSAVAALIVSTTRPQ